MRIDDGLYLSIYKCIRVIVAKILEVAKFFNEDRILDLYGQTQHLLYHPICRDEYIHSYKRTGSKIADKSG